MRECLSGIRSGETIYIKLPQEFSSLEPNFFQQYQVKKKLVVFNAFVLKYMVHLRNKFRV